MYILPSFRGYSSFDALFADDFGPSAVAFKSQAYLDSELNDFCTGCACGTCAELSHQSDDANKGPDYNEGATDLPAGTTTPASMAVGSTFTGTLSFVGDRDWVAITLNAGTAYNFSLQGANSSSGTLSDPYLRLYDANGVLVAENDDGGAGLESLIANFSTTTGGTFYLAAGSFADQGTGTYSLGASLYTPPPVFSQDQIASQLTNGYWGGNTRSWTLNSSRELTVNLDALTSAGQTLALAALQLWRDATGITFTQVSGTANITFDDDESGAFARSTVSGGTQIVSVEVNVSTAWLGTYGTGLNSYSLQTYIHEIGHALGLGHAGNYNSSATYGVDNNHLNDSWQGSVMSYFSQTENTFITASRLYAVGPQIADIIAIRNLYGTSGNTRTGDTTYGFNSNAGNTLFDASSNGIGANVSFTIIDDGGIDTLDYSGFSSNQTISLVAETASNIGGFTGNIQIARGVVIENAIGGSGNDTIVGNDASNYLAGNNGNDTINGGGGTDFIFGGAGNDIINGGDGADIFIYSLSGAADGSDQYNGGESLDYITFGSATTALIIDLVTQSNNSGAALGDTFSSVEIFSLGSGGDTFRGDTGNSFVYAGDGNDFLYGGGGGDILVGEGGNDFFQSGPLGDLMVGGTGIDTFYYSLNQLEQDQILDFQSGTDRLEFEASAFGFNVGQGLVGGVNFIVTTAAAGAAYSHTGTVFIYYQDLGFLYVDADGANPQAASLFIAFGAATALAASDLTFVNRTSSAVVLDEKPDVQDEFDPFSPFESANPFDTDSTSHASSVTPLHRVLDTSMLDMPEIDDGGIARFPWDDWDNLLA